MKLIDSKTKKEVKIGEERTTFRGEKVKIAHVWQPGTSQGGRGGRIQTEEGDVFFPAVVDAEFVPNEVETSA